MTARRRRRSPKQTEGLSRLAGVRTPRLFLCLPALIVMGAAVGAGTAAAEDPPSSAAIAASYGAATAPSVTTPTGAGGPKEDVTVTFTGFCPSELLTVTVDGTSIGSFLIGPTGSVSVLVPGTMLPSGVAGALIVGVVANPTVDGCGETASLVPVQQASLPAVASQAAGTGQSAGTGARLPTTGANSLSTLRLAAALLAAGLGIVVVTATRRRRVDLGAIRSR